MNNHEHPHLRTTRNLTSESQAAVRVTVIGMILDAVLGLAKMIGGALFNSQALLVDGIHSFTDVASDLVVLAVMKLSRRGPDANHPYGHQRIETLGTMLLGSFLIAIGGALAWENLARLWTTSGLLAPGWPVLVLALASVLGKEWIYRYTRRVGERIRSDLIIANAWHSRTDAFSSIVVLISTAGALMGFVWLDALAAVVVAIIIAHVGWRFTWDSVRELVDTGLPDADTERLLTIARKTEGVRGVHHLRIRKMGHDILLDVHLLVKPEVSVSEGHQVGMAVVRRLREAMPDIRDINFHIDPENDESTTPTGGALPSREDIHTLLTEQVGLAPPHPRIRLHYLDNQLHLELFFEAGTRAPGPADIRQRLGTPDWLGSVKVWCRPHGE